MKNFLEVPIISCYIDYWKRGFQFRGRTSRSSFWWSALAGIIVAFFLYLPHYQMYLDFFSRIDEESSTFTAPLEITIFGFLNYLPTLSIYVRRLRDAGKSWKWLFINLIPFIGFLWFFYIMISPSFEKQSNS